MRFHVSRRTVVFGITGTFAGVGLAGVGSLWACKRRVVADAAAIRIRFSEALSEVFEPERLAQHWPGPGSQQVLLQEILARPGLVRALEVTCEGSRRVALRAAFASDFTAGDVLVVDRLLVAQSECLIAALCIKHGSYA